jgi:hypothetical protein
MNFFFMLRQNVKYVGPKWICAKNFIASMLLALSVQQAECKFSAECKRQQWPNADWTSATITDFKELWMWYTNC